MQCFSKYSLNSKIAVALASWVAELWAQSHLWHGWIWVTRYPVSSLEGLQPSKISKGLTESLFFFLLFLFWVDVRRQKEESKILFRKINHQNHSLRSLLWFIFSKLLSLFKCFLYIPYNYNLIFVEWPQL